MVPLPGTDRQTTGSLPPELQPDSRQHTIQPAAECRCPSDRCRHSPPAPLVSRPCAVLTAAVRRWSCARRCYNTRARSTCQSPASSLADPREASPLAGTAAPRPPPGTFLDNQMWTDRPHETGRRQINQRWLLPRD